MPTAIEEAVRTYSRLIVRVDTGTA
jgi:hypothetical protein